MKLSSVLIAFPGLWDADPAGSRDWPHIRRSRGLGRFMFLSLKKQRGPRSYICRQSLLILHHPRPASRASRRFLVPSGAGAEVTSPSDESWIQTSVEKLSGARASQGPQ